MENYKSYYYQLFSAISDHIDMLEQTYQSSSDEKKRQFLSAETHALKSLLNDAEERFIQEDD